MITMSLAEAKNRLSELVARVEGGEEVSVTRRGKPVARLVPAAPSSEEDRQAQVAEVFRQLEELAGPIRLDHDVKSVAREGLD